MRSSRTLLVLGLVSVAAACGSRTALLVGDVPEDASVDAAIDHRVTDASRDVRDVSLDSLPGFDAMKPDSQPPNDCPDADATLVYLITSANELLSFYPPTATFKTIGTIACPGAGGNTPFSMAVSRKGTAYVVFTDGSLYQVSTATASCKSTSFMQNQDGFLTFGMGFSGDKTTETLFVSQSVYNGMPSKGLASIDTTSFVLSFVGGFMPAIPRCELTGTGDGRLFAYWPNTATSGSNIAQVDPATAAVTGIDQLMVGGSMDAFAFAFWGGDFWVFTSPGGASTVTQFDPVALTETTAATYSGTIVGAGVSTCAPQ